MNLPKRAKNLVIDNEVWHWKANRSGIYVFDPNMGKQFYDWRQLGYNPTHVDYAQEEHNFRITPDKVKAYILTGVIKKKDNPDK